MIKAIQKGFTLIELLVVITIIGILATGAVTTFTSQIQKARDTTRIGDVKALQSGIEQFYQDESVYPRGLDQWVGDGTVQDYVPNLAQDPKDNQTCNGSQCGYAYEVAQDDNGIDQGSYEISTAFENAGNIKNKAGAGKDTGDDPNRLEFNVGEGSTAGKRNTLKASGDEFDTTTAGSNATQIHIIKDSVTAF